MRILWVVIVFVFVLGNRTYSQSWVSVGNSDNMEGVIGLFGDTLNNILFAYGQVHIYDTVTPIASQVVFKLNSNHWDTIDKRNKPFLGGMVNDMINYKGKYYAIGGFSEIGSSISSFYGVYQSGKWDSLPVKPEGPGIIMKEYDDTLYIGGSFYKVGGINSPSIVKYDGNTYHGLDPLDVDTLGNNAPWVSDIEKFNGDLVVCGTLFEHNSTTKDNLVVYKDGIKTTPINWSIGYQTNLYSMEVFQNDLYVAGRFEKSDGFSLGNNILRWNGTDWFELGDGCNGIISKLLTYGDTLIVLGGFTECDGIAAQYIAMWTGRQWCSVTTDHLNNLISDALVFNDTLYITGNFINLGSDSVNFIAKWNGPLTGISCGPDIYDGIEEENEIGQTIYPNPAWNEVMIQSAIEFTYYYIVDVSGRLILNGVPNSNRIDVSNLIDGVYYLRLIHDKGMVTEKMIIRTQ